ncbi:hypothetical protein GCM10022416_03100 [Actinomadura keratinilytica]|uniref:Uncharacterized protein n=1 Tax=Actinomadura keratinilytica TaxID=547461 RepID=A0ABP7XYU5_9ACTN
MQVPEVVRVVHRALVPRGDVRQRRVAQPVEAGRQVQVERDERVAFRASRSGIVFALRRGYRWTSTGKRSAAGTNAVVQCAFSATSRTPARRSASSTSVCRSPYRAAAPSLRDVRGVVNGWARIWPCGWAPGRAGDGRPTG